MGKIRSVIADCETILVAQGYTRARENFTLERVGDAQLHKAYTFGVLRLSPLYQASNVSDYGNAAIDLLIAWRVMGSHNSAGTYQEGYLDLLDAFESLETAMVKNQSQSNDEQITFGNTVIEPLISEDNQEYLVLQVTLLLDCIREM